MADEEEKICVWLLCAQLGALVGIAAKEGVDGATPEGSKWMPSHTWQLSG